MEIFGFESVRGNFGLTNYNAVFGELASIGEFVAEFFVGKDNGDGVAFFAEFASKAEAFVVFVFGHWNDGVIDEIVGGGIEKIRFIKDIKEASKTNGATYAREGLVRKVFGKIVITATAGDGADVFVLW